MRTGARTSRKCDGHVPASGLFAADIADYLKRVAAKPTYKQIAAHLELWAQALGRQRARRTIKTEEIELVIQDWLTAGLDSQTVRKRRTSLQSLFVKLDGKRAMNPVKGASADQLKPPKPEARGLDYLTIGKILDAMPDRRIVERGTTGGPSLGKLRVAVLAYTGLPPGLLASVGPNEHLQLGVGTVRVHARRKGRGTEPRTLPLTPDGLAAFKAFHAANVYGQFAINGVNVSFKSAAKRAGIDPTTVHLYDLRHSFGMELYRVTRDLGDGRAVPGMLRLADHRALCAGRERGSRPCGGGGVRRVARAAAAAVAEGRAGTEPRKKVTRQSYPRRQASRAQILTCGIGGSERAALRPRDQLRYGRITITRPTATARQVVRQPA